MKLRNVLVVVALTGVALAAAAQGIGMVGSALNGVASAAEADQNSLVLALAAVALVLTIIRRCTSRPS